MEKMQLIQISFGRFQEKRYSPEVEGAVAHQVTNQTRLSACGARDTLVPPMHVDRPRYREEED